jgi:hypothetical protein
MKPVYSVLYIARGELFKIGPFNSEKAAWAWLNDGKKRREEFDVASQHVYILTPDHRMIEVCSSDLKTEVLIKNLRIAKIECPHCLKAVDIHSTTVQKNKEGVNLVVKCPFCLERSRVVKYLWLESSC